MKIALDYDGTYTADRDFWDGVITLAKTRNHEVIIVTKRGPSNQGFIAVDGCKVFHTDRKAKWEFMQGMDKPRIDIWIDDEPHQLFKDG